VTVLRSKLPRAGALLLALACVGSTGCITTSIVSNVQYQNRLREMEAARQRRIAALEPKAAAGDAEARFALANELLAGPGQDQAALRRALALLEQAAAQDYGPAMGRLGRILAEGRGGNYVSVPPDLRDRERGIVLLQRAFAHGCNLASVGCPAERASLALANAGRPEQARIWRARGILECGTSRPAYLLWESTGTHVEPARRADALAILLLTRDTDTIATARNAMSADDFAAAERHAAELQRQIAASERDYPGPPRKEQP
jgi:TPR repeat protein